MPSPNLWLATIPGLGMVLIAFAAVVFWRRSSKVALRCFSIGAALWAVAVAVKVAIALPVSPWVVGWLKSNLPYAGFIICGSLYLGAFSSLCEIGLTALAVKLWPRLGRKPDEAIAIGVGAGAVEALLLGIGGLVAVAIAASSGADSEEVRQQMATTQATVPLFWLLGPVERSLALGAHVGCRALVLTGAVRQRMGMLISGFLLFASVDSIAGLYHLSGANVSLWWVELAIVPFALVGLSAAHWCRRLPDDGSHLDRQPAGLVSG
jgi:uncharacterized membrane protein YhfC